jgi:hypothetical protein
MRALIKDRKAIMSKGPITNPITPIVVKPTYIPKSADKVPSSMFEAISFGSIE